LRDEPTCFTLGPQVVGPHDVDDATVVEPADPSDPNVTHLTLPGDGESSVDGWIIDFTLTNEGLDLFNATAEECFEQTTDCPTGQIAIVVDGSVFSAPRIEATSFKRDQFALTAPGLSRDEAERIVERLTE
jgi:hypothetical protein